MKKFVLFSVTLLSLLFIVVSCDVGLGEQVDLEAPVVQIVSPKKLANVHLEFDLEGTCTDNVGVTEVIVSNFSTGEQYGYANIDGTNWSYPVKLNKENEGEITLQVVANDLAGNKSTTSIKTITLLVDDTAPESGEWYIERGSGISIYLKSLSSLQSLDTEISENKDIPQNQSFSIHGKVSDSMSINNVKISLKDESGTEVISKTTTGTYTPVVSFTHNELVSARPDLASGKHYLRVSFVCEDDHKNSITKDLDWLLWYPESDYPRITKKSVIQMLIKNTIPVDYFDDDQVEEIQIALKMDTSPELVGVTEESLKTNATQRNAIFDEANRVTTNSDTTKKEYIYTKTLQSGVREDTYIIPSSEIEVAAQMKLVVCLKDSNGLWNAFITPVYITDGEVPLLYIESPTENTTPNIKAGETSIFEVKGYALDKRTNPGIIYILYIPKEISNKEQLTNKTFLELYGTDEDYKISYGTSAKYITDSQKTTISGNSSGTLSLSFGTLKWIKATADGSFSDPTNSNWHKNTYSFDYNLLSEFGEGGGKQDKYFTLLYVDINGNKTTKQLLLNGDETPPVISVTSPASDMIVKNPETETLTLSFTATKATGLGINASSYKISLLGTDVSYSGNSKTLSTTDLADIKSKTSQPTFEFSAEDMLGNKGTDRRTVVLSVLPKAESITSDKADGTYKTGDKLSFQVNFDGEVKVTGTPKLKLDNISKEATYVSGSNTKTLRFEYTVEADMECSGVTCPATNYIDLNGGAIETASVGSGNANLGKLTGKNLNGRSIKIDSKSPEFTTIKLTSTGTTNNSKKYAKADDVITAELTANETILVSGSPKLILKSNSSNLEFNFQEVSGSTVTFTHRITSSTPNGTVGLNGTAYLTSSDSQTIKDEVGNALSITAMTLPSGSETVVIDTNAPVAPTLKLRAAGGASDEALTAGIKNKTQTLKFSNCEIGASVYYSLNGGSSWIKITDTEKTNGVSLPVGSSSITAKQIDIAGNESSIPTAVNINIQPTFPAVTGLTITNAGGYYKHTTSPATVITFKLNFEDTVKLTTAGAKLTFTNYAGTGSYEASFATTTDSGAKVLTATYEIPANANINGIKVTGLTVGSLQDPYGNFPGTTPISSFLTDGNGWRSDIIIDAVAPTLSSTVPAANGGVQRHAGNSTDKFEISLTFTEPVYTESGYITLQRIGADTTTNKDNWAIPAVLSSDNFMKIYNQLSSADKEILMETNAGNGTGSEKLQATTARPVGPYMKLTQGLNADGSPDQTTKFVLAPEYGLFGTSGTVNNIRDVLVKTGYHQHKVDIKSSQVSGDGTNTITITFNDEIEDGQHWALLIDSTCLRDSAQNYYSGITEINGSSYHMWSKNVAQPVVRVDRYSHNIGAKEPKLASAPANGYQIVSSANASSAAYIQEIKTWNDNGTTYDNASADSATKLAPTGYAKVRIDCETPGATLKFKVYTDAKNNGATEGANNPPSTSTYDSNGKISKIENKSVSTLTCETTDTAYTQGEWIFVGDGLYTSARKDYVAALATAPAAASAMDNSTVGCEGVFKTVVTYKKTTNSNPYTKQIQIQGGTFNGGMPSVSGFPLRDAVYGENSQRYNQNTYYNSANYIHYWVTYDIISEYSILSVNSSDNPWSQQYSYGAYGQISTLLNIDHYNNN